MKPFLCSLLGPMILMGLVHFQFFFNLVVFASLNNGGISSDLEGFFHNLYIEKLYLAISLDPITSFSFDRGDIHKILLSWFYCVATHFLPNVRLIVLSSLPLLIVHFRNISFFI